MVIDIHLNSAPKLIGIQIAGDRDHGGAIKPGIADACREVGRTRSKRCNPQTRRIGHATHYIGCKTGGTFVRRQDEGQIVQLHSSISGNTFPLGIPKPYVVPARLRI